MSIYGNPMMLGGGGSGGSENAFASVNAPTSADGENGQYWFQLRDGGEEDYPALKSQPSDSANTGTAGWEFMANVAITVVGLRAMTRSSYTGAIKLANSSGTVLAEVSVSFAAGEWVDAALENPVTLTAGSRYIVMIYGDRGTLLYQNNPITVSDVTYVVGRYNGLPGTLESTTCYSCDIIIQGNNLPPYEVTKQYYKSGGTWTEVT